MSSEMSDHQVKTAANLVIQNLCVRYNEAGIAAVENFSLSVRAGEFVSLLGPSGCGKTTILNAISGFLTPDSGQILVDNKVVRGPGPDRGVVFQDFALFPHLNALGNVSFGSEMRKLSRRERRQHGLEMLATVGLADHAAAYPIQLSGGMKQRVALARCFANRPQLLLMDEPFGSLDAQTRTAMQYLLLKVWSAHISTVVFVTHDIEEALILSDRIIILTPAPARIKDQVAVTFERPRNRQITTRSDFIDTKKRILDLIDTFEYTK
jgi:NitT/TauT family transport system ATP-binding protein